ncbi:hypothetical protein [Sinisalibacter aestuarii]|uniref:Uncharacterized protein n=1 Tax=Sinisalibacter aestuarii TaxID=2949426 RepID=A0ABQ5LSY9_9RHOB|nr:hypothetical protein [Sinisalibacter aestuarii]GKY87441.1 hypothetical protein STA1M1_13100 [Sinisalibacter aestuarii]
MTVMEHSFGLVTAYEERALRLRLLFRLLRDFDFNAPRFQGEMITDPACPDQTGEFWAPR